MQTEVTPTQSANWHIGLFFCCFIFFYAHFYVVQPGKSALAFGVAEVAQTTGKSRGSIYYWARRVKNGEVPKPRTYITPPKFTQIQQLEIEFAVESIVLEKKQLISVAEIVKYVTATTQLDVNAYHIKKLFLRWDWSFKKPVRMSKRKFTKKNIARYMQYAIWIQDIPIAKTKFLDESHFEIRSTLFYLFVFLLIY